MKKCYIPKNFSSNSLGVIAQANTIIDAYEAQGFDLTLRQLYYQFVSRGLIPNKDTEYKKLGSIINDARLAGLIDWTRISDRTRNVRSLSHWANPAGVIESALASYHLDYWRGQSYRPEVWIEKDALVGVIEGVCQEFDVPYFSCRGYTSQSEMWSAGQRLLRTRRNGQKPLILHLGDHDPSGIDMSRDIFDRLDLFTGDVPVDRLALNRGNASAQGVLFARATETSQTSRTARPPTSASLTHQVSPLRQRRRGRRSSGA